MTPETRKISGYMMVKDEAPHVRVALECILRHVDDLYVMDCGSKDDTYNIVAEVARKDKRVRHDRIPQIGGRYAPEWNEPLRRNQCMKNCFYDWILTIDGDETLDDIPPEYFRGVPTSVCFDTCNVLNHTEHLVCESTPDGPKNWWPDPHVRFFDRRVYRYNELPLHCYLMDSTGRHALHTASNSGYVLWHWHVTAKPDRMLDNPEGRARFTIAPLPKPFPSLTMFRSGL